MNHPDSAVGAPKLTTPTVAAVDLGSNSIKLTVARLDNDGHVVPLRQAMETVRLGSGVDETGRLAGDRITAAIAVLQRFAGAARELGATRLVGVATEAVRRASNGSEFLQRVAVETGWAVRLVSGDEEAALTFRGLSHEMDLAGRSVIADIGGGSTELIIAEGTAIELARSLPLGSGTLTERLVRHDPPLLDELAACQQVGRDILAPFLLARAGPTRLIAIGGTGEYMDRLVPAGEALDRAMIASILTRLTTIDAVALAKLIDIPPARARVLPAGIAVVSTLADLVHPTAIATGPSGIRLGLILDTLEGPRP